MDIILASLIIFTLPFVMQFYHHYGGSEFLLPKNKDKWNTFDKICDSGKYNLSIMLAIFSILVFLSYQFDPWIFSISLIAYIPFALIYFFYIARSTYYYYK